MSVKARFWVQKVTKQAVSGGNVMRSVELAPVIRSVGQPGDGENVDWSKYTPSGSITLNVTAEAAGDWFESMLGQDVSITFDAAQ
jgi:hypothetical protein